MNVAWHVASALEGVGVEAAWVESSAGTSGVSGAADEGASGVLEDGTRVALDGSADVLEVDVLHAHVGASSRVVAGSVLQVVVVQMSMLKVVGRWAPGSQVLEEARVDGHSGGDILSPADSESLVVVAEPSVGDGDKGGVETEIDKTISATLKDTMIDPDVAGGISLNTVPVVSLSVPVSIVGITNLEVSDDDVLDTVDSKSTFVDLTGATDTDNSLVAGDLQLNVSRCFSRHIYRSTYLSGLVLSKSHTLISVPLGLTVIRPWTLMTYLPDMPAYRTRSA